MTVTYYGGRILRGLSSDTKPTTNLPTNYIFLETDTLLIYYWDGTEWLLYFGESFGSTKKEGKFEGIQTNAGSSGLFGNNLTTIATGTGGGGGTQRSSAGVRIRYTTGATANSLGGTRANTVLWTERDLNPIVEFKAALQQTTNNRCIMGFTSTSNANPTAGVDPLANLSGVIFFYDSGVDGNWHICQNDGSATSDNTTINNVVAADTSAHIFRLRADNANTKFQYSYAGGAWTNINTKIPGATTGMGLVWYMENLSGTNTFDMYWVKVRQDD